MSKTTIFLDIDGVLNDAFVLAGEVPSMICGQKLYRIQKLCHVFDAQVVMSSSWRHGKSVQWFRDNLNLPVVDKTPSIPNADRDDEIKKWREDNKFDGPWIAIDDFPDVKTNVIATHAGVAVNSKDNRNVWFEGGFLDRNYDEAVVLLCSQGAETYSYQFDSASMYKTLSACCKVCPSKDYLITDKIVLF